MHSKKYITAGSPDAKRAIILLHGRGATAEDILGLAQHLDVNDYYCIAPQATQYTWYPNSFLAPSLQNEPWLSSAIELVKQLTENLNANGVTDENIFFAGFSQGACLTLEFTARYARRWGGVIAFTGGLIGGQLNQDNYKGNFAGTPVFIGTSDPDPHVPIVRVQESVAQLRAMHAEVHLEIYKGMGHTINTDEIAKANEFVLRA